MSDWTLENCFRYIADAIRYYADCNVAIAKANNETAIRVAKISSGRSCCQPDHLEGYAE